jgi:hypothetical protein
LLAFFFQGLNVGQVTEALMHTDTPTINNWGEGILISNHLVSQSDFNHCIVTEEVYNLLNDKYLYRPAGSFLVEYTTTFKQQEQQSAQYISIYYLLGRIIGDNIFKGRYSLPKLVKPLCLRNSEIIDDIDFNNKSNSNNANRFSIENYNQTNKIKSFKSSVSTDSGNSSSNTRNPNTKHIQSPVYTARMNNNLTSNPISEYVLHEKEESEPSTRNRDSNYIFLTQDMIVGNNKNEKNDSLSELNQNSNRIQNEQGACDDTESLAQSRHAPLVHPETWMDTDDINCDDLFDKESAVRQLTANDCDDVSQVEQELIDITNGIANTDHINQYEDILYDYLSNHNEDFIKEWLNEQYMLFLQAHQLEDRNKFDYLKTYLQPPKTNNENINVDVHVNSQMQFSNRKNMKSKFYQSSSAQSTQPSSPSFYQKRLRNSRARRGWSLRRPFVGASIGPFYSNKNRFACDNNVETTPNSSDYDQDDEIDDRPSSKVVNLKLNPIDFEHTRRNYKSSSEFSLNENLGCLDDDDGDDDETADEKLANIRKAFLPKLKASCSPRFSTGTKLSPNKLYIEERVQRKEPNHPPLPSQSGVNKRSVHAPTRRDMSDRGKALLNQYIHLKNSMNTSSAASSGHSTNMRRQHNRSKTLNFKTRYYSWLLRSPATSLSNMNNRNVGNPARNSLLDGIHVNSDSMSSLNSNNPYKPASSHCNDSEYDNYRPKQQTPPINNFKSSLNCKNQLISTDDEVNTNDGQSNKSRYLIAELIEKQTQEFCEIFDDLDNETESQDELTQLVPIQDSKIMSTILEMSIDTDRENNDRSDLDASITQ